MPVLTKLIIGNVRNISAAELIPSAGFNLLCGANGSGKTSVLESMHLLAMGRTFRSHLQKPVIKEGEATATVYGETSSAEALGIQRSARGGQLVHINGKRSESLANLTRALPLQLISAATFGILEGSPRQRRQFLDWGVFHVEQPFFNYWKLAKAALLNRNSLLKSGAPAAEIEPWSHELAKNAAYIDRFRSSYASNLESELRGAVQVLLGDQFSERFFFRYFRGWFSESDLSDQLMKDMSKDKKYGFTTSGPQKADLVFKFGELNAADVLSRGQLKLFVCALKIAQSKLLYKSTGRNCIFLIDDLPAELDAPNREKVCSLLGDLQDQIFLSCIEEEALLSYAQAGSMKRAISQQVFHVKHGTITNH